MARIIPLHGDEHEEIRRLLPWYVTDRLAPAERACVAAHLEVCAECQAEARSELRLKTEVRAMPLDAGRDWARLRRRLDAQDRAPAPMSPAASTRRGGWSVAARPAALVACVIAAQVVVLAVLALWVAELRAPAEYRALSDPPVAEAHIMVAFRPEMPERDLRAALNAADVRLVDGPTAAGAYVVRAPRADLDRTLSTLRAQPAVSLAETLDPAGPR